MEYIDLNPIEKIKQELSNNYKEITHININDIWSDYVITFDIIATLEIKNIPQYIENLGGLNSKVKNLITNSYSNNEIYNTISNNKTISTEFNRPTTTYKIININILKDSTEEKIFINSLIDLEVYLNSEVQKQIQIKNDYQKEKELKLLKDIDTLFV